jgi:hypothetical protein
MPTCHLSTGIVALNFNGEINVEVSVDELNLALGRDVSLVLVPRSTRPGPSGPRYAWDDGVTLHA